VTLKDRVKELCTNNSITLAQLEKKLSLGNGTLSRWNKSSPSIDKVQEVANYFNLSIDCLVGNEEIQKKKPKITAIDGQTAFYAEFKAMAEILGYKIHLYNEDMSKIEFEGKEALLKTSSVVTLMDTIMSFIKFTLQEAIKGTSVAGEKDCEDQKHSAYDEASETLIVAARGGTYTLDKQAAQSLAQSASKAPNRSHDKNLF